MIKHGDIKRCARLHFGVRTAAADRLICSVAAEWCGRSEQQQQRCRSAAHHSYVKI